MKFCNSPLKYALIIYFLTLLPALLAESPRIAPCLERTELPVLKTAAKLLDEAGKRTGLVRFSEWQKAILERGQNSLTSSLDALFAPRTEKTNAPAQAIATPPREKTLLAEKTPPPLTPPTVVTEVPTPDAAPETSVHPPLVEVEQPFDTSSGTMPLKTDPTGTRGLAEEALSAPCAPLPIADHPTLETASLPKETSPPSPTLEIPPKNPVSQNTDALMSPPSSDAKKPASSDASGHAARADTPQATKDAAKPCLSAAAQVPPPSPHQKTEELPVPEPLGASTDAPHQATELPRLETPPALSPSSPEKRPVPGLPENAATVADKEPPALDSKPLANAPALSFGQQKSPETNTAQSTPEKAPSSATPPKSHEKPSTTAPDAPHASKRILIIGDSFIMEGFGPTLHKTLMTYQNIEVIREGKYSTGLTRQDLFDWPEKARELTQRLRPDAVCICLGANDPQDIIDQNKKRHIAGTDSWQTLYYERVKKMLEAASGADAQVLWIGLPIMGKTKYETQIRLLTSLQQKACNENSKYVFLATEDSLKDEQGNYTTFVKDSQNRHVRIRSKDKIHVTGEGGKLMVGSILPSLESLLSLQKKTPDNAQKSN